MVSNLLNVLRGNSAVHVPQRVQDDIWRQQDRSEQIISFVQLAIVLIFGALFVIAPRPFEGEIGFELTPWALGLYLVFTVVRLIASYRVRLPGWFLTVSVIADMALLMVLIWSFHRTYQQPPSFYLKSPTLLYVFIFIALRALRFDARYVLLAGGTAIVGWAILMIYAAALDTEGMSITRDYILYMTGNKILLGAEFDKIITIAVVTVVLAVAVVRARRTLVAAASEGSAKRDLSRFFDANVARQITAGDNQVVAGQGEYRNAAVLMLDIRGFTALSNSLPAADLIRLLSDYQARVVPVIQGRGGNIDKFLGDGVMATFGAAVPSNTYAADALRAVDEVLEAMAAWNEERAAADLAPVSVNAAVATGELIFGAVGDDQRLEYTVIGEPVNLAAKLEKHAKVERVRGLVTDVAYQTALRQGYEPRTAHELRRNRNVDGVDGPVDLVMVAI
jgi:adenylate cyclase